MRGVEDENSDEPDDHVPLIECGWLIVRILGEAERAAVIAARDRTLEKLQELFPEYRWKMPLVEWTEPVRTDREFAIDLLKEGARQREQRHWDYVLVITPADLCAYIKPHTLATPSRSLSAAVLSLARIGVTLTGGRPDLQAATNGDRKTGRGSNLDEKCIDRIMALAMHLLGDLNDLPHSNDSNNYMYQPRDAADLERMQVFDSASLEQLRTELRDTADIRLEEIPQGRRSGRLLFTLRALWHGREEIGSAVLQAMPWQFPFRLSGLSTAAISTLIVLLASAEGWDLGTALTPMAVVTLSLIALAVTCTFIILRQGLLIHSPQSRDRPTEQAIFTNAAVVMIVLLGMITTWVLLFSLGLILTLTLFPEALIQSWAATVNESLTLRHYLTLTGFTAAMGIIIGALGASFEGQQYFQHIALVDEEV